MQTKKVEISKNYLLKRIQDGATDIELAHEFELSVKTIRNRRKEYGIEAANRGRPAGRKDSVSRKKRDAPIIEPINLKPRPRPINPNKGIRNEDMPKLAISVYNCKDKVAVLEETYAGQLGMPKKVGVKYNGPKRTK